MSVWDRTSTESSRAFAAFRQYRDLPPASRSIDVAWRKTAATAEEKQRREDMRAPGRWFQWCSDFKWDSRAKAYDEHLDQIEQHAVEQQRIAIIRRRAQNALIAQDRLEDLSNWQRIWIEKNNQLPPADVDRTERTESPLKGGGVQKTITRTKIQGLKQSAAARLSKEHRDTTLQMQDGLIPDPKHSSQLAVLPPFVIHTHPPRRPGVERPAESNISRS
jgi:hypothetical protein